MPDADPWAALEAVLSPAEVEALREAVLQQIQQPPRIAVIGHTGVGKTSTINALFGTSLKVSDVLSGTKNPVETRVPVDPASLPTVEGLAVRQDISAPHGLITVIDMPGLGETIAWDRIYLEVYRAVLPTVDVALWVMDESRALASTEHYLGQLREMLHETVFKRLVFCVNKVDTFEPGEWNTLVNLPGEQQEQSITTHLHRLEEVLGVSSERLVAYSAKKRYNLLPLLNAMLRAVPEARRVALDQRAFLADPFEFVEPQYRPYVEKLLKSYHL